MISALIGSLGALSAFTYFALWILMLLHWKDHEFKTRQQRAKWLFVLLISSFVGAIIYYFRVAAKHKPVEL